ncbi:Indoleamine 2,3-dioxygenase [Candidatus Methylomirabilis lanthanidiphila]|uniref:Indoleamine 2,3-dioxygenase n=1 Tax=Candidatus Methylomirabilis lanthanidiphila TaxID=2211376 RepID=A0A564ZF28_9BACT|nr:Indoleamine 2,3-dioxygenase [Candidatus Methylomirabilis lanthanidiphila]
MNNGSTELQNTVRQLMDTHGVSVETGFLAERPLRWLLKDTGRIQQVKDFEQLDAMAYALEQTISERQVAESVERLDVPCWSFEDLPWPVVYRLMLIYAMCTHAYFREVYPYGNVSELMQDQRPKTLPAQLAVPLWRASRRIGMEPTMSYGLYALWNYYRKDPEKPVSVENIELIHSFTGTPDERWFVRIHQAVEAAFAPAIPELLTACLLSRGYDPDGPMPSPRRFEDNVIVEEMIHCLENATKAAQDAVVVLKRMREHCDYGTYFNQVRLFFTFPNSVVFNGVEELAGIPQQKLGETGGQTPFMHFQLAAAGIDHDDDPYFPRMRHYMSKPFRDLIEFVKQTSKIRSFVLERRHNDQLVRAYNALIQAVPLDWRFVHMRLVEDFIGRFGESHGTGKPPLDWLSALHKKATSYLITL